MDPRLQHARERKQLSAVLDSLLPRLREIARAEAERAARELHPDGRSLEVVSEFAEPVITRIASKLYGVPAPEPAYSAVIDTSDGEVLLAQWLRKAGCLIASTWPAPFGLKGVGEACAKELAAHLDAVISRPASADTVLGRLQLCLPPERVRANLAGLMLAGSTALVKSFVHALRELLAREKKLREALDHDALRAALLEAMRFAPTFPMVLRYCPRELRLGSGARARTIPRGATVYVSLMSAMFDDELGDADLFADARPEHQYLHFGAGPHECLGRAIAAETLEAMLHAFLAVPRVIGAAPGRVRYDGPAVERFRIALAPEPR